MFRGIFSLMTTCKTNYQTIYFMKIKFLLAFVTLAFSALAQDKKMPSPPDKATGNAGGVTVTVDYHQPSAKGRKVMGGLVPFGDVWRTGANATTAIEFSDNVKLEGNAVAKGKYGLYTIPGENEWTIIINKDIKWGAYDYKQANDVVRFTVKPGKTASFVETFKITIENNKVVLRWENTEVAFAVAKG